MLEKLLAVLLVDLDIVHRDQHAPGVILGRGILLELHDLIVNRGRSADRELAQIHRQVILRLNGIRSSVGRLLHKFQAFQAKARRVFGMFDKITAPVDFDFIITHSIDNAVKVHENNAAIHEALHSLSSTDKTVRDKFMALENDMTTRFVAKLRSLGYDREDIFERVHLAMETVQSYAHEKVFDKHSYIDYDRMRKIVIDMLVSLFKK